MKPEFSEILIEKHPESGYVLKTEMVVEQSIDVVFGFFSDAGNLGSITPDWVNFKILSSLPIEMRKGTLLDYTIRLHGIPLKWQTEICEWNSPKRFVDQQLRGPYKKWYHDHTFVDLGNGKTLARDCVHYIPRGGSLIHRFMVKPDLLKIFEYRQQKLAEIFSGDTISVSQAPSHSVSASSV